MLWVKFNIERNLSLFHFRRDIMKEKNSHPVIKRVMTHLSSLTPKGRVLGKYIIEHPTQSRFHDHTGAI